ncbi:DUF3098 domain-containing protein [Lewinella sp. 4G2]|uniref:DUF3098 domain-containing protein n=1 Tax=Lewinella sp. 4G2 TaxID=1803372 RepID=UPI0007DFF04D|nr:DUF3098 domain-containing protein [Lewinella sp. 4G2]OAV46024.1 hypothetical protein A3850_017275 [Lewinella sp. 4G2]
MAKGRKKDKKVKIAAESTRIASPKVAVPKVKFEEPKRTVAQPARALTFGPETYKWMGIGFGLVVLGLILMAGSRGDNFSEFDINDIYSPVKTTLAPAIILAGLGVTIYAILKK